MLRQSDIVVTLIPFYVLSNANKKKSRRTKIRNRQRKGHKKQKKSYSSRDYVY